MVTNKDKPKLGVVCCYFNPCNYLSKFLNYIEFAYSIKESDIHLITVEAYNSESAWRINKVTDDVISVQSDETYWQKEGLLNIGIKKLLELNFNYIAWVDTDIKFLTRDWPTKVVSKLDEYDVVQLFDHVYKETINEKYIFSNSVGSTLPNTSLEDNVNQLLRRRGELGYGYAYHANVMKNMLLYDKAIMGAGDILNMLGLMYCTHMERSITDDRFFRGCHPEFVNDFIEWSKTNPQVARVGYCNINILTKYHGELSDRQYIKREDILKKHKYVPCKDLNKDQVGLYKITNKELANDIKTYFKSRKEDDYLKTDKVKNQRLGNIVSIIKGKNPSIKRKLKLSDISPRAPKKLPSFTMFNLENYSPDVMVIASKIKEDFFSLSRVKYKDKVLIDKANHKQRSSVVSKNLGQHGETYLNFIVKFYHLLPSRCIFINEKVKSKKYVNLLNTLYKTKIPRGFRPLIPNIRAPLKVADNFKVWWDQYMNDTPIEPHMKYSPGGNFIIDAETIQKRSKEFYERLLTSVNTPNHSKGEYYLERAWEYIFK